MLTVYTIIPTIALGNSVLNKPSYNCPLTGLEVERLFREAGFVNNEFVVVLSSNQHTELIISNKYISGVSFTGSTKTGGIIASIAGKYIKKVVMELGGSDAVIILKDVDVEKAVDLSLKTRLWNNG